MLPIISYVSVTLPPTPHRVLPVADWQQVPAAPTDLQGWERRAPLCHVWHGSANCHGFVDNDQRLVNKCTHEQGECVAGRGVVVSPIRHQPIHPSNAPTHSFTHPPIPPPLYPSTYPPIHGSLCHPSTHPTNHLATDPPTHPSTHPLIQPSSHPSSHPSTHPPNHRTNHPTIHPTIEPTIQPPNHRTTHPTIIPSNHPTSLMEVIFEGCHRLKARWVDGRMGGW